MREPTKDSSLSNLEHMKPIPAIPTLFEPTGKNWDKPATELRAQLRRFFLQPRQLAHKKEQIAYVNSPRRQITGPQI